MPVELDHGTLPALAGCLPAALDCYTPSRYTDTRLWNRWVGVASAVVPVQGVGCFILAFFCSPRLLRTLSKGNEKPLLLLAADNSQSLLLKGLRLLSFRLFNRPASGLPRSSMISLKSAGCASEKALSGIDTLDPKDRQTDLSEFVLESAIRYAKPECRRYRSGERRNYQQRHQSCPCSTGYRFRSCHDTIVRKGSLLTAPGQSHEDGLSWK